MKAEQILDLESQQGLLKDMNSKLKRRNQFLQIENQVFQKLEQKRRHETPSQLVIIGSVIIALFAFSLYFTGIQSHTGNTDATYNSKYFIENLRGDTMSTWLHWNIVKGEKITVNIVNSGAVAKESISAIKDAIMSDKTVKIDDLLTHKGPEGTSSTYYKGWHGALKEASKKSTEFHIPTEFVILESSKGEGDIVIRLLTERDSDGYSGYAKSITENKQIIKSTITIYNVDSLSAEQIGTIMRHEFGHALGLAHSTASEDLMAPQIGTPSYISECNVDAISALYDGEDLSQVVCQK